MSKKEEFEKLEKQHIEVVGMPEAAISYLGDYYKTLGDGTRKYLGVKTGLEVLDKKTLGLDGLIILGGIAGQGKTSLALQLAFDACELGTPTIFYSLEMPRRAIFTKLLNRFSGQLYTDILLKGSTDEMKENLKEAKEKLEKVGSFFVRSLEDKTEINFESVEEEINAIKASQKADKVFVVIDHLQVFNVKAKEYRDQIDKENRLITGFKKICERTGATILLISQKNKAGFTSKGLQTIKGSVDIVYLADVVMFLEGEDEQKEEDNNLSQIAEIFGELKKIDFLIAKNRYNAPCKIELDFNGAMSLFDSRH